MPLDFHHVAIEIETTPFLLGAQTFLSILHVCVDWLVQGLQRTGYNGTKCKTRVYKIDVERLGKSHLWSFLYYYMSHHFIPIWSMRCKCRYVRWLQSLDWGAPFGREIQRVQQGEVRVLKDLCPLYKDYTLNSSLMYRWSQICFLSKMF